MILQRLEAKDFSTWRDQIAELFNDSVKINFPGFSVKGSYGKDKCDEVNTFLEDGSALVFIARDKDKLAGWVWCHRINRLGRLRLHIAEIAVSKECRKQGIGKELLDTVETYARENRYCEIDLFVTANNTAAVTFYEKASYIKERYLMRKNVMVQHCDRTNEEK